MHTSDSKLRFGAATRNTSPEEGGVLTAKEAGILSSSKSVQQTKVFVLYT